MPSTTVRQERRGRIGLRIVRVDDGRLACRYARPDDRTPRDLIDVQGFVWVVSKYREEAARDGEAEA